MIEKSATQTKSVITHGFPPYYAYLEHLDGRWYATWMTRTEPKTERGHPWHVHADYSDEKRLEFKGAEGWFTAVYGMRNWDFDTLEEAVAFFMHERLGPRLKGEYTLVQGHLPEPTMEQWQSEA